MKRILGFIVLALMMAGVFSTSCKRGTSIGAVGNPMDDPFPVFDTFNFPTSDYFFYGKFNGSFKMWQDGLRSSWDTITRRQTDPDDEAWEDWPPYNANIYRNIPEEFHDDPCINDSDNVWFEHLTRFLRPEIPEERIEIYFYDCIEEFDTIPERPSFGSTPGSPEIVTSLTMVNEDIAQPFTTTEFGRMGMKVVYVDSRRDRWETRAGSGQLLDTYIRIHDIYERDTAMYPLDTLGMYIVEGEFAGRLWKGNQVLPVTEAKFRARLIPRIQTEL